ncbi:DNA cytosine methyltransferase [Crocosphaera sp. UHCC 0190]|uniref:DNA cytosine methyltransferase n=1 Tax=Crocosphaera sp. UHCC 0190 TaxID=3110246 RepID=UPI002B1FF593|nr:DNA cytosine methyltransferase [Crocosphaera sp. UHCC 0190]MEA5509154.1 DNA cytosine methyltransferase [Crocosphaera sp. UHCC 0190]
MKTHENHQQLELFKAFKPISLTFCQTKFTFIDLFAGIGGFRIPLEQLGGKCLGYSEIDTEAIKVYQKNFISYCNSEEINLGDLTRITNLPDKIDLLVGGVPCQPWSIAGKLKGFEDPRGKLWFDVIRLVKNHQPKAFIFENVKGLTEPRNKVSFESIINQLEASGYWVTYAILNSYDFGLPQDRDRVFIIGINKIIENYANFSFPKPLANTPKLYQIIPGISQQKLNKKKFDPDILFEGKIPVSRGRFQKIDELNDFFMFSDIRDGHTTIHSWDLIRTTEREKKICQIILRNRRKKKYGDKDGNPLTLEILRELITNLQENELEKLIKKKILKTVKDQGYDFVNSKISSGINGVSKIFLPHSDVLATLTATGTRDYIATQSFTCQDHKIYKENFIQEIYFKKKYKPLSSRDYAKLQGFPDWFILADNENTAKKQLGNAVSVPVVYHLTKSLLKTIL